LRITWNDYAQPNGVHIAAPEPIDKGQAAFHEESNTLAELLLRSVNQRLVSDVPVGFAASGGLDSSLILGIAAAGRKEKLKGLYAFSAVSGNPASDETHWQELVSDHTGVIRIVSQTDASHASELEDMMRSTDLPAAGWNNLAHYRLCGLARQKGVLVMLNGQGADELMAGYHAYLPFWFAEANLPDKLEWLANTDRAGLSMLAWWKLWARHQYQCYIKAHRYEQKRLARKPFMGLLHPAIKAAIIPAGELPGSLNEKLRADYYGAKLAQMLQWEDRNSMAHGLESRNPFADDFQLAAACFGIPASEKIKHGFTKYPLREIAANFLPEAISWRRDKKGFSFPDGQLTRQSDYLFKSWLDNIPTNIADASGIRQILDNPKATEAELGFAFRAACLARFMELNNIRS
jgi:asparagine synthase (glutamine-hydrolysing)